MVSEITRGKVIISCAICPNNDLNDVLDGVWKVADEGSGNLCVDQATKSFIELKIQNTHGHVLMVTCCQR